MANLNTQQADFITAVRNNTPYPHGNEAERISIYRRNLDGGLVGAMEITYPVVNQLVGDDFFRASIRQFREQHMPNSTNLDSYGAEFSDFLANFTPAQVLPYLADVARLEWLISLAIKAESPSLLHMNALPQDPEQLGNTTITPHPAAALFHSTHAIDTVWAMHQQPQPSDQRQPPIDINQPCYSLITRPEFTVKMTPLDPAEYHFLTALFAEKTLYEAFELASSTNPAFNLVISLQKAIVAGSFTGSSSI